MHAGNQLTIYAVNRDTPVPAPFNWSLHPLYKLEAIAVVDGGTNTRDPAIVLQLIAPDGEIVNAAITGELWQMTADNIKSIREGYLRGQNPTQPNLGIGPKKDDSIRPQNLN